MNIQSVLGELEQLGYSISLDGENIRCKYLALIEPPREKVLPLLETIKTNKKVVIDYLKPKHSPIPLPEAFDPDGLLNEVISFWQGRQDGEAQCIDHISQMVADGMLKSPWGFKVKDSPVIGGDYWIISDITARERIPPPEGMSFTIEELKPIVETCKVFNGKVVEIKKLQTRQVANGN